ATGAFFVRFRKMARTVRAEKVEHVDLARVPDGSYEGEFSDFLVKVKARVNVAGGRIEAVEIVEQHCGPGYEARETVDRILEAQSPVVDVVSGATGSSKCIMAAVSRALLSAPTPGE
ncbi:MAG: FMN-binding protein, partial [bacterium]